MKKNNKKEKIDSIDHVAVVLEDMNSKFGIVVESVSELNKKIDRVSDNLEEFKEETKNNFKAVAGALTEINDRLDNHENKIDNLESKVDNLGSKVDNMQGTIDNMQGDITEIKHKLSEKVDLEDFQNLEKRFIKLEKLVFAKLA